MSTRVEYNKARLRFVKTQTEEQKDPTTYQWFSRLWLTKALYLTKVKIWGHFMWD